MPDAPVPAIRAERLTRKYGEQVAVDALELVVPAGAFYGFIGPNGAGKSTTINMLTGLIGPTSGRAEILGLDVAQDPLGVKRAIGVVPDGLALFERLTGREHLVFTARLYGLARREAARRADELLAAVELTADANKLAGQFSHGMRKRLALACALIHGPRVAFLDEPFEGMDAVSRESLQQLLASLVRGGSLTVFLTSHELATVERLCTHLGVLVKGRLAAAGTPDEVRALVPGAATLQEAFVALVGGGRERASGLSFF